MHDVCTGRSRESLLRLTSASETDWIGQTGIADRIISRRGSRHQVSDVEDVMPSIALRWLERGTLTAVARQ